MLNKLKKIDWGIIAILVCLMFISTILVRSATHNNALYHNYDVKTLIYYGIGFCIAIIATVFDYRILLKGWHVLYGIGVTLLILVYFFGSEINGAKGWFQLPGFLFQPAEIMKIIIIIGIAYIMGRRQGDKLTFTKDLVPVAAFSFLPFMLVMIQPDLGNAIIYLVIVLGMLWIGNVKYTHVLVGMATVIAAVILFVSLFNTFNSQIYDYLDLHKKKHWYQRINTFINPEQASQDDKHQSVNARIAIGSGGLSGDGYMQGDMLKGKFIPYPYSDSIFVVVGEEFGFQGSAVLLLLYFLLIYRMIIIAFKCYDQKASFIVIGIATMFVFQIFQNIGMMIGLMPITGITLPFISYGGTSLLLNMISIGIVFSIKAHQEKYELAD
ncbi:FtsW/RodA/SpoVE family cell cycle protein [Paenibacillus radicis (ex Gao et al. 2016)]|uniref:Rod shape-determining protein RodA n=1 Tax=Paenibacillus radicis (ex Gao et al. 2016) TaxID=1737354 RepID=A0A917HCB3_9BACL|nr:FtsW/RodA/SpoVE family cell cycle protein [Paenibacillus radicis (ex Gao et al. 2016)]GGG74264.1 rod shape-determining protein RodA [Paenibacillus radicis (ex Gao et al. 2016)]